MISDTYTSRFLAERNPDTYPHTDGYVPPVRTPENVLVIDDTRTLIFDSTIVRRWEPALETLYSQPWDEVWLDHDLECSLTRAEFIERGQRDYNIRPLIDKMVEDAEQGIILPIKRIFIHSANSWGRVWMRDRLAPYYTVEMVNHYEWEDWKKSTWSSSRYAVDSFDSDWNFAIKK